VPQLAELWLRLIERRPGMCELRRLRSVDDEVPVAFRCGRTSGDRRPCDAAGLPDEMSGSPRDRATRAVLSKALRGRKSEKRERPRIRAATPLRPDWLPMRCVQGLAISSGTLAQHQGADHRANQSRTGTTETVTSTVHGSTEGLSGPRNAKRELCMK